MSGIDCSQAACSGAQVYGAGARQALNDPASSEYRELQRLKARDREVRAHEQAHQAAGGQYIQGGMSFSYQKGPDGRSYAVGGEVSIDTAKVPNDPQATLRKMQVVQAAALAPAEPSAQDRAVAAQAAQAAAQARQELAQQQVQAGEDAATGTQRAADQYRHYQDGEAAALIDLMA